MESILISIRPEWCELILAGKKTIEIRKTMPKIKAPFKCYIYETKGIYMPQLIDSRFKFQGVGKVIGEFICDYIDEYQAEFTDLNIYDSLDNNVCQNTISKIIGYNEDDDVEERQYITGNEEENPDDCELLKNSCLTFNELRQYIGETFYDKSFYGYHISDLKIYDEPKELSHFIKPGYEEMETLEDTLCNYCSPTEYGTHKSSTSPISGVWFCEGRWCESSYKKYLEKEFSLKHPPQSWCYVEECV